jgi:glycosyltransferase involved in cell wall biosynthesis
MVLLELIRGLDRRRFRPIVVSLQAPAVLSNQFRAAGADVHHFNMSKPAQAPLVVARVARLARSLRPDILHGVMFYGDFVCRALKAVVPGVRVVGAIHSTHIGPPAWSLLLRLTDPFVEAVTAVSDVVAQTHRTQRTTNPEKLVVIQNGIDENRFGRPSDVELERLRQELAVENAPVLLAVGRLEKEKNFFLLLAAFARLKVPGAVLVLVGDGSQRRALELEARRRGVEGEVRFLGHVDPVNPLFHLADVFVMSSDVEGLPLVMLEAMAAGVPMVLTNVGGIPDVAAHEETALLVEAGDAEALAAAIARVLAMSKDERARYTTAARAVFRQRFSVRRMVEDSEALYSRLLHGLPVHAGPNSK